MIRGTTPTFTLNITNGGADLDLTEASTVYITVRQNGVTITKTGDDLSVEAQSVSCWLTQNESLQLKESTDAEVQLNWTYTNATDGTTRRAATKPKMIRIDRQLLVEVI